jgi:hypothetical protein
MTALSVPDGNDKTWVVTVTRDGTYADITGYKFLFTVKLNLGDTDTIAVISKDITSHTNPTQGITSITVTREDTQGKFGKYFYDLQWCDDTDKRKTILETDIFTITRSVGDREC